MEKTHQLILKNDDHNNYLYVIACLMRACNHDKEQAEQCAIIAHNVGQCQVKIGDFLQIMEIQETLNSLSIDVEMQEYESDMHKF